jgi:hypothetical protein
MFAFRLSALRPLSEVDRRGVRNTITIESEQLVALELPPSSSLLHG